MNRKYLALVQSAVGLGLIFWIFHQMQNKSDLLEALRAAARHWPLLGSALAVFGVCVGLVTVRWQYFLERQGLQLSFGRTLVLYLVGHFFNSFLFGVTGGDIVKAYYAARETRHKKAEAVTTVVVDRAVGLVALVVLAAAMMLVRLRFFLGNPITRFLFFFFLSLFFACVVMALVVLKKPLTVTTEQGAVSRNRLAAFAQRGYAAVRLCLSPPTLLVKAMLLSLANHILFVLSSYFLGRALEIHLGFLDYLVIFPVISSVAALPITPGGLGTRDVSCRSFLGMLGVAETRAVLLSGLIYAMLLAWSLIGGVVYLIYSCETGRVSPLALEES